MHFCTISLCSLHPSQYALVSALILETGVPVSILFADTRDIGGKTYGQILLELPGEDRLAQRVTAWLDANFPSYSLEV